MEKRVKIKLMKPVMMAKSNSILNPRTMALTRKVMVMMSVMMRWPKRRMSKRMKLALREKASRIKRSMTVKKSPLRTVRPLRRTTTWTMAKVRETMSKRPMKVSPLATQT